MEKARRMARRRALKLVRRAGARRSLERERGEWPRMCPRRWKETGAGSILCYASGATTGHLQLCSRRPALTDAWMSLVLEDRRQARCHNVKSLCVHFDCDPSRPLHISLQTFYYHFST
jgi:hypothetical protein